MGAKAERRQRQKIRYYKAGGRKRPPVSWFL